ncbi:MAG TPA: cellulase family glycosylhydrolase, partial [bacterium]|nr:cellulase family glycosylhydrolase [bacterium]
MKSDKNSQDSIRVRIVPSTKNRFSQNPIFIFLVMLFSGLLITGRSFAVPSALHTSGVSILNASNCAVTLRGVNTCSLEWNPVGEGPSSGGITASVAYAINNWKCSVVRLPLNEGFWFQWPYSYQKTVDQIVNYVSSQNAYVILD